MAKKWLNVQNTHPNLSIVISCCKASAVPGESTAPDTFLVASQCVDTLPGLAQPQLEADSNTLQNLHMLDAFTSFFL